MDPATVPFVVQEGHGVPWPLKSAKATRSDRPGKGSLSGATQSNGSPTHTSTVMGMRPMETVHAEPRISVESPTYRVNFWQRQSPRMGWNLDAYVLTDVGDVEEVLRWVEEQSRGRRFELFAETDDEPMTSFESPRTTGLIRLLGSNPNVGVPAEIGRFDQI